MGNVAVVGAQWGDEGKGKIVDWLSERAEIVVRFQGGANAGHTLVVGNVEYKLSLLPSGVVRPGKLSIIGNGGGVDPWAHHNALLRGLAAPEVDRDELIARLHQIAPQILPYAAPTWRLLDEARRAGRRILFEGAQGAMLDVDHGTYPYITSSNTVA